MTHKNKYSQLPGRYMIALAILILPAVPPPAISQDVSVDAKSFYEKALIANNPTDRIHSIRKALSLAPHFVEARIELTKVLLANGEFELARAQADSTLNDDRSNAEVWYLKGRAHAFLTEYALAQKSFSRAISLQDDRPDFYLQLGKLHFGQRSWKKALSNFELALSTAFSAEDSEAQASAWYWKGRTHIAQGDTTNGLDSFERALATQPDHEDARRHVGDIREVVQLERWHLEANEAILKKDWQRALVILQQIVEVDPQFKNAAARLTQVQHEIQASRQTPASDSDPSTEREIDVATRAPMVSEPSPTDKDSIVRSQRDSRQPGVAVEHTSPSTAGEDTLTSSPGPPENEIAQRPFLFVVAMGLIVVLAVLFFWFKRAQSQKMRNRAEGISEGGSLRSEPIEAIPTDERHDDTAKEIDRYRKECEIGAGGMGKVYKAIDLKLNRTVALKEIHLENTANQAEVEDRIKRFHKEAMTTAQLIHPNIVRLYDYQDKDGEICMIMEYVEGESLEGLLLKEEKLPVGQAVQIVTEACSALQCAHDMGVIHRDIKPSNIMLDRQGRVMVLDFGLAKLLDLSKTGSYTMAGVRVGAPLYMSPEQINAERVDGRSDIFSLGVVFYEMLTGKKPFQITEGDKLETLFNLVLTRHPLLPSSLRAEIPKGLDGIVTKMLAKMPAKRYQEPKNIVDELQPFLGTR